ncbi:hypothetical protein ATK30_5974 [Amycolatopsis echigonensis]|uniref:Uncharacterized protein n=1 Tax=Amycolatopsis echigonensis TaxID=2576905 RepID=A0A2N3WMI3_9PSEU|nr:hypothetical protein ATK30_5974 [Amycolatopsis niigatensis]
MSSDCPAESRGCRARSLLTCWKHSCPVPRSPCHARESAPRRPDARRRRGANQQAPRIPPPSLPRRVEILRAVAAAVCRSPSPEPLTPVTSFGHRGSKRPRPGSSTAISADRRARLTGGPGADRRARLTGVLDWDLASLAAPAIDAALVPPWPGSDVMRAPAVPPRVGLERPDQRRAPPRDLRGEAADQRRWLLSCRRGLAGGTRLAVARKFSGRFFGRAVGSALRSS